MPRVLQRAIEAPEIVKALRSYGVTQNDVASVAGVTDRAVRGWTTSEIRPQRYDRLADLRDLVILLSESLTPRGVEQWLHARNRLLAGAARSKHFTRVGSRRFIGRHWRSSTAPTCDLGS